MNFNDDPLDFFKAKVKKVKTLSFKESIVLAALYAVTATEAVLHCSGIVFTGIGNGSDWCKERVSAFKKKLPRTKSDSNVSSEESSGGISSPDDVGALKEVSPASNDIKGMSEDEESALSPDDKLSDSHEVSDVIDFESHRCDTTAESETENLEDQSVDEEPTIGELIQDSMDRKF